MKLPVLPVVPVIDRTVIEAAEKELLDCFARAQRDRLWCLNNLGALGNRWDLQDGGIVIYSEEDRILFELSR